MKVYLSGSVIGSYRAQNIIKVLSDSGIKFTYIPRSFFTLALNNRNANRLVSLILLMLIAPFRVVTILLATHVFVLPMNTNILSICEVVLAKILRKKVIVDYYLSDYDTLVNDRAEIAKESYKARFTLFKDRFLLKHSDRIIFLNHSECQYYQKVAGVDVHPDKVNIVPLCVDYKKEFFSDDCEIEETGFFNICWWGTYIPLHGLEKLIQAFNLVDTDQVRLYLFGNSDSKSKPYSELVEKLGLSEKVTIINDYSFSNGKLAPFLKEHCDLAIGNFGSSEKANTVLVNKLIDALSLGLPCLTMSTRATRELLDCDKDVLVTNQNPTLEDIAAKIRVVCKNREKLKEFAESGKQKYLELFSPDAFKVKLLAVLK
jgi:glycosyltransferase involved in cell wall biosynthesis